MFQFYRLRSRHSEWYSCKLRPENKRNKWNKRRENEQKKCLVFSFRQKLAENLCEPYGRDCDCDGIRDVLCVCIDLLFIVCRPINRLERAENQIKIGLRSASFVVACICFTFSMEILKNHFFSILKKTTRKKKLFFFHSLISVLLALSAWNMNKVGKKME